MNSLRKNVFAKWTPAQIIVLYYLLAVTFSTFLLKIPFVVKPGVELSFVDALFVAASAVSVTGLTPVNIAETFTTEGHFILMLIFQVGGIGIMTLGTFLWLIIGKKIGFRERRLIQLDQNQYNFSGLVNLMRHVLYLIFIIETVGALVLGFYLLQYYDSVADAFINGLFMSISATTNAGFDITGQSLQPYAGDYFIQFINIVLIILGAIGFPVLIEVKEFLVSKPGEVFHFSLFTKLTTVTFMCLVVVGTFIILILEYNRAFAGDDWHQSFFYAFFQSVSTRSGGLSTIDVSLLSEPTLLIMSVLMFIGASPSSVGGGIRTTTLALNLLFIYHFAKGNKHIKVFKREVSEYDIRKSFAVSLLAMFITCTSVIILTITEPFSLTQIIFEVCSAFGTSGLSMGITADLSTFAKMLLILLMFIGRVGIISFLLMLGGKEKKVKYRYPEERIIIG
ncbi:MAG: TrkH family potassium uptake protein [Bacillus sp. (in: firmicutes)]